MARTEHLQIQIRSIESAILQVEHPGNYTYEQVQNQRGKTCHGYVKYLQFCFQYSSNT